MGKRVIESLRQYFQEELNGKGDSLVETRQDKELTCINETLLPTTAVSPITTPVAWSKSIPSPIFAAGKKEKECSCFEQEINNMIFLE